MGRIHHRGVDTTLVLSLKGNSVVYVCDGTRMIERRVAAGGSGGSKKVKEVIDFCPHRWIDNLRSDVEWLLQAP